MLQWFDIGVNLTNPRLETESVVEQARDAGVPFMAITGTDVEESLDAVKIARQFPGLLFSTAGIHPHYSKDAGDHFIDELRSLANNPQVVAIGECGLDFNRNFSPPDTQLSVFEQQLALAAELQLPVFLHERDAFEPQCRLLEQYLPDIPGGVAHCFTGDLEQMQGYLALGLHIGVTGWLCDPKRGEALRNAVTQLPLDKVLLETDAPYLMPKTLKNKNRHNQPANLPHIAQTLAELMEVEIGELSRAAMLNTCELFRLEPQGATLAAKVS